MNVLLQGRPFGAEARARAGLGPRPRRGHSACLPWRPLPEPTLACPRAPPPGGHHPPSLRPTHGPSRCCIRDHRPHVPGTSPTPSATQSSGNLSHKGASKGRVSGVGITVSLPTPGRHRGRNEWRDVRSPPPPFQPRDPSLWRIFAPMLCPWSLALSGRQRPCT